MSASFEVGGFDELTKSMEIAGKQFPASAERVLKKEAYNVAKDLKKRVDEEAKGHNWNRAHGKGNAGAKPLQNSFSRDRVKKAGNNYTASVSSTAPHYHLYEEGHDIVGHKPKNIRKKGKVGTYKTIGHVQGRKTVARYMAKRSEHSELIGQELLNEILKEAGFDT